MAKVKIQSGRGGWMFVKELGGAPARRALSKTARVLLERGLIRGRVLDYGCGHGHDADTLGWDAWDPHYRQGPIVGPYDTIVVNHVANILTRASRAALYAAVDALLTDTGCAYLSVARNIPPTGKRAPRRRVNNYVVLSHPPLYEDPEEAIYALPHATPFTDRTREIEGRLMSDG